MVQAPSFSFRSVDTNPGADAHWKARTFSNTTPLEALPAPKLARFDWRDHGLAFVHRNQGDWNACTSFACTAMVESRRALAGRPVPRLMGGFVHYCLLGERDPNEPRNAGQFSAAASSTGLKPGDTDGPPLDSQQCAVATQMVRTLGGSYLEPGAKACNSLVANGPLVIEAFVPAGFEHLREHQIWDIATGGTTVLHAMLMISYDWAQQRLTVLGSNGPGWGNQGFATISMRAAEFHTRFPFEIKV